MQTWVNGETEGKGSVENGKTQTYRWVLKTCKILHIHVKHSIDVNYDDNWSDVKMKCKHDSMLSCK